MRIVLLLMAVMLLIAGADARYSPGLEIAEGENITLDGGYVIDAKLSGSSAFVTLGTEDWCDYKLDGSGDSTDIQAALNAYKNIYIIGSSTEYDIDNTIDFGAGRYSITGIEYNGYKPTLKVDSATTFAIFSNDAADIELSGVTIDADSKDINAVYFSGITNAKVFDCIIKNVLQSSSTTRYATWIELDPQYKNNTTFIEKCEFYNNVCGGISVCGGSQGNVWIFNNLWKGGKPYGDQAYAAIYSDGATIVENRIVGYGNLSQVYDESTGTGIHAINSMIAYNYIEGVGASGIVPMMCSVVDGNRIIAPGSAGIDFWYSSYVTVSNNYIENVGNYDNSTYDWDQSGIDLTDHSEDSLITGNMIYTRTISDTLAADAVASDEYITVTHPEYWNVGLRINLTGDLYRIDDIDFKNDRLHLVSPITGNKSAASAVASEDCCNFGIQFGDNGGGGQFHTIQGNHVFAGRTAAYGTTAGASILPYTYCDAYVYPSEPGFMRDDAKIYTYKNGENYYIGTYIVGLDSKSVQIT